MVWLFIVKIDLNGNQNHFLFLSKPAHGDVWAKAQEQPSLQLLDPVSGRGDWERRLVSGEGWGGLVSLWLYPGFKMRRLHRLRCPERCRLPFNTVQLFRLSHLCWPSSGLWLSIPISAPWGSPHMLPCVMPFTGFLRQELICPRQDPSLPPGQAIWQQADIWYMWNLLVPAVLPD